MQMLILKYFHMTIMIISKSSQGSKKRLVIKHGHDQTYFQLISHKFSEFQALPGHFVYKKLKLV